MPAITLKSPSISCGHCARTIERELGELPGVEKVRVDVASQTIAVEWHEPATIGQIAALLREINYPAEQSR